MTKNKVKKIIENNPLMIIGAILGGLVGSWTGALFGGFVGIILDSIFN